MLPLEDAAAIAALLRQNTPVFTGPPTHTNRVHVYTHKWWADQKSRGWEGVREDGREGGRE